MKINNRLKNKLIIADNCYYDMDCYKTKLNNNVLVVGTSGSGKTTSIVTPNILQATGSYIISDPKGNLYGKYGDYLKSKGYRVLKLDFVHMDQSSKYNFMHYIHCEQDIVKVVDAIYSQNSHDCEDGGFWDNSSKLLLQAVIAYLWEFADEKEQTFCNILRLLDACNVKEGCPESKNNLDRIMESIPQDSFASRQYRRFRVAAGKTLKSILISCFAAFGAYDSTQFRLMTAYDEIEIASIGDKKTAVFVVVSDTDRSMDPFVNTFFTQALNVLCEHADNDCDDNRLPIDVRFILDDFATNCIIEEFPRMISSIRSRGISTMLMIQAESQLSASYGNDGRTIVSNCDTYVYLGGNDYETADLVAQRLNVPVGDILYMGIGECVVFRRGSKPYRGNIFNLDKLVIRQQCQIKGGLEENERAV